jgi:uncharacterized lipoprotein YddW (UPF0748 family)
MIGLWHRPFEKNLEEVHETLKVCHQMGFNHLFIETFFQGKTLFDSKIIQKKHHFVE